MKTIRYSAFLFLAILFSCSGTSGNSTQTTTDAYVETLLGDSLKPFTLPTIPMIYTDPAQRADYLIKHYWDNFNFADTNYTHRPEITEQAWVDFIDLFNHVPLQTVSAGVKTMMNKASVNKKVFVYFTDLADKYLHNPNSPVRNEEFYIPFLESMMDSKVLESAEKIRPEARLKMAMKNRVGDKANDFTYTVASGTRNTLYKTKTEFILLYFNNPGCNACLEIMDGMRQSYIINKFIKDGRLIILGVYPDEDLAEWQKHRTDFEKEWINAYDKNLTIMSQSLYDLKAIPTIYLLDQNKTVLLKDATLPAVEAYLVGQN